MIWFVCKQCGKKVKQAENAAGSLVFCECGQANRVPWESTLVPEASLAETEERDRPRRRRQPEIVARDPAFCFNHPDAASEQICAACSEHFCAACVVTLRGKTLCGPCKNYRIAAIQRPPSISGLAIGSLVLAVIGGPFGFCLTTAGRMNSEGPSVMGVVLDLAALLMPVLALVLGLLALREMDRNPRLGGRALAITGAATAVIGVVWAATMMLVTVGRPLVN